MDSVMGNDVCITPMGRDDIDQVWSIEKICFPTPWSREAFRMEVEDNRCACYFVARKGNEVIGYGGMWLVIDEAHITNVAVHPEYRGKKIGEGIMRALMREAFSRHIERMTLEVRRSNLVAQNLYRKLGFEICGVRKKYYSDNNEDALIMWNGNIGNFI